MFVVVAVVVAVVTANGCCWCLLVTVIGVCLLFVGVICH